MDLVVFYLFLDYSLYSLYTYGEMNRESRDIMTGIIFDFNGTMVFDSHLHEQAWVQMIHSYHPEIPANEIIDYIHGRTNHAIIPHFIKGVSEKEILKIAEEKELAYQEQVRHEQLRFIKGTEELLDRLLALEIPFTIATASPKMNVDFYFDYFELGKWFDPKKIIYDDGTFPGKPEPDIYEKAAKMLGLTPEECIVLEDAISGIESANVAGIGKVFAMVSSDEMREAYEQSDLKYDEIFRDFNMVSKKLKDLRIL